MYLIHQAQYLRSAAAKQKPGYTAVIVNGQGLGRSGAESAINVVHLATLLPRDNSKLAPLAIKVPVGHRNLKFCHPGSV